MDAGRFGDFEIIQRRPQGGAEDAAGIEDDDDIDETMGERLLGLTEMFPKPVRSAVESFGSFSVSATKVLFSFTQKAVWIVASSATILLLPYLFERERMEMEQMQRQHERQVLLGPQAAMAGMGGQIGGPGAGRMGLVPPASSAS